VAKFFSLLWGNDHRKLALTSRHSAQGFNPIIANLLDLGTPKSSAFAANGRNEYEDEFEDEYDRRTKTILEVRGRENLVLVGVRFSSPAIVLQSSSYSFLPLAAEVPR
jgi:hypothetical protein